MEKIIQKVDQKKEEVIFFFLKFMFLCIAGKKCSRWTEIKKWLKGQEETTVGREKAVNFVEWKSSINFGAT